MKTKDAIAHFKTQKILAKALGIEQPSVAEWGEYPPPARQFQIEILTNGTLKAEDSLKPKPYEPDPPSPSADQAAA